MGRTVSIKSTRLQIGCFLVVGAILGLVTVLYWGCISLQRLSKDSHLCVTSVPCAGPGGAAERYSDVGHVRVYGGWHDGVVCVGKLLRAEWR